MDAFTILAEMGAGISLTADQLAQVRAINVRYYTGLFRLQQTGAAGPAGERVGAGQSGDAGTSDAGDELRAMLRAAVHAVLTPAQKQAIRGG